MDSPFAKRCPSVFSMPVVAVDYLCFAIVVIVMLFLLLLLIAIGNCSPLQL